MIPPKSKQCHPAKRKIQYTYSMYKKYFIHLNKKNKKTIQGLKKIILLMYISWLSAANSPFKGFSVTYFHQTFCLNITVMLLLLTSRVILYAKKT